MVTSIHEAIVEHTVPHSKHVGYFMTHHSHRPELYLVIVNLVFFDLEEARIIASEWKHSGPISDASYSKDKIPFLSGVKVSHADSHHAECVGW